LRATPGGSRQNSNLFEISMKKPTKATKKGQSGSKAKSAPPQPGEAVTRQVRLLVADRPEVKEGDDQPHKWCRVEITAVGGNNPGCSTAECEKIYPVGSKRWHQCDGDKCADEDEWYSAVGCGNLLSGCKIKVKVIESCK
jgi:hypothetical protein